MFKRVGGDWVRFRELPGVMEVDYHHDERSETPYWQRMEEVYGTALEALESAQAEGYSYVLFIHGSSTSRPGNTTARSQVRKLMRSPDSTPYIIKNKSEQHSTVFLAKVKPGSMD